MVNYKKTEQIEIIINKLIFYHLFDKTGNIFIRYYCYFLEFIIKNFTKLSTIEDDINILKGIDKNIIKKFITLYYVTFMFECYTFSLVYDAAMFRLNMYPNNELKNKYINYQNKLTITKNYIGNYIIPTFCNIKIEETAYKYNYDIIIIESDKIKFAQMSINELKNELIKYYALYYKCAMNEEVFSDRTKFMNAYYYSKYIEELIIK